MKHRNDPTPWRSAVFPSGPRADLFPVAPAAPLTAVTVFTTYTVPPPPDAPPHTPPLVTAAICACGDTWHSDNTLLLRRLLGGHSCAEHAQGPVELVPIDDEPDDDTLSRVLDGLRSL